MESYLSEEASWASGLAARLKLIQANFADDQPAARRGFLQEELERSLKEVPLSKRTVFLRALSERFPAWQSSVTARETVITPAPSEAPEALAERLIVAARELPPEVKAHLAQSLQQAGFILTGPASPAVTDVPEELQKKLGLTAGQALHSGRALKLLAALVELNQALDQLAWALWKQVAPRSAMRKEAEMAKLIGPYLAGDPEVSTQQVSLPLEKTRKLIAGLLGGLGRAAKVFAQKHVGRFSPDQIEDWAKMEKKWSESLEQASWRKYKQHFEEHGTEPAIENDLQEAIAKTAENLMTGRPVG